MDHRLIEEQNLADLYVAGQLPPEDEERFEEHLLECRECRERVAWAEDLKGSFQALAAEEGTRAAEVSLLAVLLRRGRWLGIAALVLLALAFPAWLLVEQGRLREELAAARAAAKASPPPAGKEAELRAERDRLEAERRKLEGELDAERGRSQDLAGKLAGLTRPQVNTALFSLGLVRGQEEENRVTVEARPAWIVLSLEIPPGNFEAYRATLVDARGRTVWKGEGLRPTASDTLVLGLYSDLLSPGGYRLLLEGLPPQGRPDPIEIPFQVVQQPGD